jgi:hypothetical protein
MHPRAGNTNHDVIGGKSERGKTGGNKKVGNYNTVTFYGKYL